MKALSTTVPLSILALACAAVVCMAEGRLYLRGVANLAQGQQIAASSNAGPPATKYHCTSAVDGAAETWWASADRAPLPQWLRITFDQPRRLDAVAILQADNPAIYAYWKDVTLTFSDGSVVSASLPATSAPFIIRFPARETSMLQVTIQSVHAPNHYITCAELLALFDPDRRADPRPDLKEVWNKMDLTPVGSAQHPCVYQTPEDVARARQRCETYPWARDYKQSVLTEADRWLARPDEWYRQVLPKAGACFAYGFTGCPICNASWGTWGGARCSWDNPGHVTCANGHVLPDAEHPDDGTGFKGPDGRIHYFVGSYNAWVVEKLGSEGGGASEMLALAYSLTGDERYADKAGVILDALAAIYPGCTSGSWDYPSTPPSGRFDRPWYQVARVLVHYVETYDQIYASPSLDRPSVMPGMTRRQNIEQNLLLNGATYCYQQSLHGGLHNGEADYIRGALAVGCCLGIEGYVEWALNGPYGILNMIENNCDRDGRYFETSAMYANHTRELYLTFSEPLLNYRSARYPNGVNLYRNAKFRSFYLLPELGLACQGHSPRYGDSGPDTSRDFVRGQPFSRLDYDFAERLYARAANGADRRDLAALVAYLAQGDVEKARAQSGHKQWLVFHAAEPPTDTPGALPPDLQRRIFSTDFFGQKGIAILRSGTGPHGQAALIRFGPALNHGHLDDLNLNYYGLGYELTYDLGYGLGSTHTQVGWSHQTASHNLVVVDEKSQGSDRTDGSGGSLLLLADLPGLQVVEADAPATYRAEGVTCYRRLLALAGDGPDKYLLDIFRIRGGKQHDYFFHTLGASVETTVPLGPPEPGSLAGPHISWGDMQLNDGDIAGFPNKPYWNPPPGNGYGFLTAPRRGATDGTWQATFPIAPQDDCHLRLTMLGQPGTEVIAATAPGILPRLPKAAYVLARRRGEAPLQSTYIAVMEPYSLPAPEGVTDAATLMADARITAGEKRLLPEIGVLLFKGTAAGDRLTVTAPCPQEGDYRITIGHYVSPGYGTVQMLVDGKPQGPEFSASAQEAGPAAPRDMGLVHLPAGPHQFTFELTRPSPGGTFWFGLQTLGLAPANATAPTPAVATPFLAQVTRLVRTGPSSPDADPVGVAVARKNGDVDLFFSDDNAESPGVYTMGAGAIQVAAAFAHVRLSGDALRQADIVQGTRLAAAGAILAPQTAAYSGTIDVCDYPAHAFVTAAPLPTDGRLEGRIIHFDNPRYTRSTSYRIARVEPAAAGVRVLLSAPTTLGKVQLDDDPPDDHTITSLIPHEYCRCLQRNSAGFFDGKLLRAVDRQWQTHVAATAFGQPMSLSLDATAGLHRDDILEYCDIQAGDTFTIPTQASLIWLAEGRYELRATCDVDLALPVAAGAGLSYRTPDGDWVRLEAGRGTVPFSAMPGGVTTLTTAPQVPH